MTVNEHQRKRFSAAREQRGLAVALSKKILTQVHASREGFMMWSVFHTAVQDLFDKHERASATRYLKGDLLHLQLAGVDPDWVHLQFKRAGINLEPIFDER